ncbi:MAG: MBL fold metallo-hydrolase [Methanomassiliicoccales archaeon]|nr:MBL fold metallo-hydrolase [Methanomassiliicoccales archaeon]
MKDHAWYDVPGAPGVRIFPFIRKPDVVCCNSYIIKAPGHIMVIDPGADQTQMEEILRMLRDLSGDGMERVTFFLTHCHVDHCYALMKGIGTSMMPDGVIMLAQAEGAKALREYDEDVTQARVMGWDFPPVELQVELRSLLTGDMPDEGKVVQSTQMQEMGTAEGMKIGYQRIPLGEGLEMVAYHTPGHSPDSVCYRLGRLMFTGDLLFATDPGIMGSVGWDRDAMESSIRNASWLLEHEGIELCLPGHGYCVETAKARTMLERMLKEVRNIGAIKTKDAERIRFTSNYALDMLEEANENFSVIAGRLYYLAYHLEDLEEGSEARKYLDMLEHDRIDEMLTSFNRFVEEFHAGRKLQLQVTMKAVQTMNSINAIFKGSDLEAVMDRSLISGTSRLLKDFMNAVKGIELDVVHEERDLRSLVQEIVEDQTARPEDDIMDCLDDPERYASALARRIAHIPVFDDIELHLEGDGATTMLDPKRFQDSLSGLFLDLAGSDVKKIVLRLDGTSLEIGTDVDLSSTVGEKKVRALSRRFELAGAKLSVIDGAHWHCRIECDRP